MATKRGKPFEKGKSGNPGGRPQKIRHVQELARTHTQEAIATLAKIMSDENESGSARTRAAESLLDRAWGKAPAAIEPPPLDKHLPELSEAQTNARIEQLLDILSDDLAIEESPTNT